MPPIRGRGSDVPSEVPSDAPSSREGRFHEAPLDELPEGVFVLREARPWLMLGAAILRWTPSGYIERTPPASSRRAVLIAPQSSIIVLRTRWGSVVRLLHRMALGSFAA